MPEREPEQVGAPDPHPARRHVSLSHRFKLRSYPLPVTFYLATGILLSASAASTAAVLYLYLTKG